MAEFAELASIQALAAALLHFLWQGLLIALAAMALMRAARTAAVRYTIGIVALVAMLAAPATTVAILLNADSAAWPSTALGVSPGGSVSEVAEMPGLRAEPAGFGSVDTRLWPAAGVVAWMTGMILLSVRLAGGWLIARRMTTRGVKPAAAHVQAAAAVLAQKLGLRRAVRVLESSAVAVPVLVGWLRPAVVFPVAALAGLSPVQIEALLAHELAHVHRHDYLVNLLQSLAEVVLFYHPAVWWLSRRVRMERELCCDDLAVGLCDRLVYATALTDLAAMRSPRVALAATGGDLLTRVKRILRREEPTMSSNARWIPVVAVAALTMAGVPVLLASVRAASGASTASLPASVVRDDGTSTSTIAQPEQGTEQSAARERELQVRAELQSRLEALRALMQARAVQLDAQALRLAESEVTGEQDQRVRETEERARQAAIEIARRDLEASRRLFETGLVSRSHLAEKEKALALAEAGHDERRRHEVEVSALRRQLEDSRQRYEVGLMSRDDLARLEAELALLQSSGDLQKRTEIEFAEHNRQLARSRELFEKGLLSQGQVQEHERLLKEFEQKSLEHKAEQKLFGQLMKERLLEPKQQKEFEEMVKGALMELEKNKGLWEKDLDRQLRTLEPKYKELERQYKDAQQKYKEVLAEVEKGKGQQAPSKLRMVTPDDPVKLADAITEQVASRPIEVGDILFVTIEGESQLPSIYRIENNGSVRVPLLGTFKVLGQTPGQVREAIGKRLLDAKLGSPAKVHVEIRRER